MNSQISLTDYYGRIGNHYPTVMLWDFLTQTEFVITEIVQPSPVPQADTYFTDGSTKGIGGIHSPVIHPEGLTVQLLIY